MSKKIQPRGVDSTSKITETSKKKITDSLVSSFYRKAKILILLVIAFTVAISGIYVPKTHAATLSNVVVAELSGSGAAMVAAAGNELAIQFQPASTGAPTNITLAFNSPWVTNSGAVAASITSSSSCTVSGGGPFANADTGITSTGSVTGSGNTITFPYSTSLSSSTTYCTLLTTTTTVTNPSSGVYTATLTSGSDSNTVGLDVLSSGGSQYSVTVSVPSTFTLSLSNTTDSFSSPGTTLASGSVNTTTGITALVATNALSGYLIWAEDSNSGLHSANASTTIGSVTCGSNASFSSGSDAYGLGVSAHNTADYAYTSSTHGGCLSNSQYYEIASGAATSSDSMVLHELATITASTPAAPDYTDTITVIGAGNF